MAWSYAPKLEPACHRSKMQGLSPSLLEASFIIRKAVVTFPEVKPMMKIDIVPPSENNSRKSCSESWFMDVWVSSPTRAACSGTTTWLISNSPKQEIIEISWKKLKWFLMPTEAARSCISGAAKHTVSVRIYTTITAFAVLLYHCIRPASASRTLLKGKCMTSCVPHQWACILTRVIVAWRGNTTPNYRTFCSSAITTAALNGVSAISRWFPAKLPCDQVWGSSIILRTEGRAGPSETSMRAKFRGSKKGWRRTRSIFWWQISRILDLPSNVKLLLIMMIVTPGAWHGNQIILDVRARWEAFACASSLRTTPPPSWLASLS